MAEHGLEVPLRAETDADHTEPLEVEHAHTGALAGSNAVFDALCEQYGVIRVADFDQLIETAGSFTAFGSRLPKSGRTGTITISGGQVGMLLDLTGHSGVTLEDLTETTHADLATVLGRPVPISNPLDAGGTGGRPEVYARCLDLIAADPSVDLVAVCSPADANGKRAQEVADATLALRQRTAKPVAFLTADAEAVAPASRSALIAAEIPVLTAGRSGFDTLSRCIRFAAAVAPAPSPHPPQTAPLSSEVGRLLQAGRPNLNEHASLSVLAACGIPVVPHALVTNSDQAVAAAEHIGYPVAVKACSADLPHKSDVGAVRLNCRTPPDVAAAYAEVVNNVRSHAPTAALDGVLVAAMRSGIELIAGIVRDAAYGPVVLVGIGGIFAEVVNDVAMRLAPLSRSDADAMIGGLKGARLLGGYRGRATVDREALVATIVTLSDLAITLPSDVHAIDINPLIASGEGVVAVDALVTRRAG